MRSLHYGRRPDRPAGPGYRGITRGLAIDLGSSRTRAWMPGHGVITDARSDFGTGAGHGHPVRRGRIVDFESGGRGGGAPAARAPPPTPGTPRRGRRAHPRG
ncbi:hypothetical protein ACFV1Q_32300, partial [Streptomyces sp. NPDC059604]